MIYVYIYIYICIYLYIYIERERYIRTSLRPIGPPGLLHGCGGAVGLSLPDPFGRLVVPNEASLRPI